MRITTWTDQLTHLTASTPPFTRLVTQHMNKISTRIMSLLLSVGVYRLAFTRQGESSKTNRKKPRVHKMAVSSDERPFGNFGIEDPETFYKCVNRVDTGYIRTEADELQYNLHVMLRFDLEIADIWRSRCE